MAFMVSGEAVKKLIRAFMVAPVKQAGLLNRPGGKEVEKPVQIRAELEGLADPIRMILGDQFANPSTAEWHRHGTPAALPRPAFGSGGGASDPRRAVAAQPRAGGGAGYRPAGGGGYL